MSVVEFAIAMPIALFGLFAGHELVRIIAIDRSADLIIHSAASTASLTSLSHIALKSFESDGRKVSSFEKKLNETLLSGLQDSLLHWSFFSTWKNESKTTINGIRSYARGPTREQQFSDIHLSTHICISSWLEPIIRNVVPDRNCLGQFTSYQNSDLGQANGIMISASARRSVPFWIPTFFLGLQNE